jgi:hypothetical protein
LHSVLTASADEPSILRAASFVHALVQQVGSPKQVAELVVVVVDGSGRVMPMTRAPSSLRNALISRYGCSPPPG